MSDEAMQNFSDKLAQTAIIIEQSLSDYLSFEPKTDEIARPADLINAMRHGALNGGKRLRPFLVLETANLFGGNQSAAVKVATALEAIHCYSLIHDDLPAMDNDDLRRGEPTVHIAYDEATAILAGDALLTMAFDILASDDLDLASDKKLALISALSKASGLGGMVGGQMLDLAAEKNQPDEAGILMLQQMKTGALIRFACQAGPIIGNAKDEEVSLMIKFGQLIGQAFQLADDLLDVTADAKAMGKNTGKDAEQGKATLVAHHGLDWSRTKLKELADSSIDLLSKIDRDTSTLQEAAFFIISRDR